MDVVELVAVAIVTSEPGVLVGRRRDGRPPWTFLGGKLEAGETPAEAARREVMEEAGLDVVVGAEIGQRVHPVTGRLLVYLEAVAEDTAIRAAAGDQIVEVRWAATTHELNELMPSEQVFPAVREHLARILDR